MNSAELAENVRTLATIEVMKRVLIPVHDDAPDPGTDFEGCCRAMAERVLAQVRLTPLERRQDFFLIQAAGVVSWCFGHRETGLLLQKAQDWLIALNQGTRQ